MGTNGNLLNVGTSVDLSIDNQNTIRIALILLAAGFLFGVAGYLGFKLFGK